MLTNQPRIDKTLCMKGAIRTKEKCPRCGSKFTGNPLRCHACLTTPTRYYIDLYVSGHGKLKIYSDKRGSSLDSYERAHRVLESLRYEIDQHIFDPSKYLSSNIKDYRFEERVQEWYQSKTREVEKGNLAESYTIKLKCYMESYYLPFFKGIDIRDIRTFHIQRFYDQLPSTKSLKYLKNILGGLKHFFNTLHRFEYISQKPIFPVIQVNQVTPKWIDYETQLKMLGSIPFEDRPIFAFLMFQGVRPSEARALKVKDINLKERYILITRTFSYKKLRERVKSKVSRPRLINPALISMLIDLCKDKFPESFVFINPRTKTFYSAETLFRIWDKVRKEFELSITLYEATRHSLASIAACNGASLNAIKDVLGHTDIRTTLKYAHSNLESQKVVFQEPEKVVHIVPRHAPKEK